MNPILEKSLEVAVRSSTRSQWFRETLKAIMGQADHEKTAFGAFELIRVVKQHQKDAIHEHNRKRNPNSVREDPVIRPRLHELTECAMRQYLGLPVPEPDLDYNRFLIRYCESAGWLHRFDQDRDWKKFDRTGILPPILRAKDLANPPGLWGKLFEAPGYLDSKNLTKEEEIRRIEASPVSAPWLSKAMRSIPKDEEDVYHRHVTAEGRYLLCFAAAIHRDTPPDLGRDILPPGEKDVFRGASGDPEVLNFFKQVPAENALAPRDRYSIGITKDAPFLARLLERGVEEVYEVQDERLRTYWFYNGEEARHFAEDNWVKPPQSYSRQEIRKRFNEIFWDLRRLLSIHLKYSCSITGPNITLRSREDAAPSEELLKFAASLKHPFTPGDRDPMLHDPGKIRFYEWEPTEPGVTFCPIDGRVEAPLLLHHSGKPTIDDVTVCPDCLGTLYWDEKIHFCY